MKRYFHYRSLDELQQGARELGTDCVRFESDPTRVRQRLANPVDVGGFRVGNSIAIHPMEGCDGTADGSPGELTWRRYERFARGGAKLIWFEATAVCSDGRANSRQLWITPENAADFARLAARIRQVHSESYGTADDLLLPIQLTHSGRYSASNRVTACHNPYIGANGPLIADEELERLEDDYVEAGCLAWKAGFEAIDIKVTHGYLLSELTGARQREGRYGGALRNRLRFIENVAGKLRAALGSRLLLCVRLGCFDGVPFVRDPASKLGAPCRYDVPYPFGFGVNEQDPLTEDLTEVKQTIAWLREWGVRLVNISMGCPYYNPHIGRPFEKADEGNYDPPEHPLLGVDRHFRIAGELQRAFPDLPMVGTGYSWLQKYCLNAAARNLADGNIHFFGMGRGALAYPDFARAALESGELDERHVCKTLTFCTYLMRQKNHPLGQFPTGCPPFDKEGYGEIIKLARHAAQQRELPHVP